MANENMDMKRMQEEAIHRVQEMQNRANQQLRGTPSFAASPRTNRSNNGPSFSSGTQDRKSTRLNSSHRSLSRMPSSA